MAVLMWPQWASLCMQPLPNMSAAPKIVVVGASGYIGKATIAHLVKHADPKTVTVVTRNPGAPAAEEFKALGVHVVAGDLGAPASLAAPFAGATSVLIIVPGTEVRCRALQGRRRGLGAWWLLGGVRGGRRQTRPSVSGVGSVAANNSPVSFVLGVWCGHGPGPVGPLALPFRSHHKDPGVGRGGARRVGVWVGEGRKRRGAWLGCERFVAGCGPL